jgi:hypothetical protein
MYMLVIGQVVRIKQDAWIRDFPAHKEPFVPTQVVKYIKDNRVMLSFPLHWWFEDDLEILIEE